MFINQGIQNELNIIDYLNAKRYKDLNRKWKKHIKVMFPYIKRKDVIKAYRFWDHFAKPDIVIKVNKKEVNVSIKTGRNPSMHDEKIDSFINYLRKLNVSERTIKIVLFYHYGETEKLNNNGHPFTREEILQNYKKYIDQANKELNQEYILTMLIKRCVLKGTELRRGYTNFIYYGVLDDGYLMSDEEIYKLIKDDNSDEDRGIHFGGLIYQAGARIISSNRREEVKIRWPLLNHKFYNHSLTNIKDEKKKR